MSNVDPAATFRLESFCVVIPMYNEEAGAEACVRRVCQELERLPYRNALIAVNDGSRDATGAILDRLAGCFPKLEVVRHERNAGYGAALRTGVEHARAQGFQYAVFMDSDLTNDPADLVRFIEKMEQGIDVIKASRYVASGAMRGVPWKRRVVSQAGNALARILFGLGIRDCTNGFRAVKVGILARMRLSERGFPIIMEELYQCKFLANSFCEIPVVLTNRDAEARPTSFSYTPDTFKRYLKFGLKAFLRIKPPFDQGDRL